MPATRSQVRDHRPGDGLPREVRLRAFATRGLRRLRIKRAYWYTWASSYRAGRALGFFEFAGLRRFSGGALSDRPALRAYRASAQRYEGCAKTSRAKCK